MGGDVLSFLQSIGPGAAVAVIAFYYMDRKDSRSEKIIGDLANRHSLDRQASAAKSEEVIKNITLEFRAEIEATRENCQSEQKELRDAFEVNLNKIREGWGKNIGAQ